MASPVELADAVSRNSHELREQEKDDKTLVAVVPDADGNSSLVIRVVPNARDAAVPPTVKFSKGALDAAVHAPELKVDEAHIVISHGSGGSHAEEFFQQAVSPVLQALFPASFSDFQIHKTTSATSILELATDVFLPKAQAGLSLRIILLSGDGGIADLVNGLLSQPADEDYNPPQVVLLPLGTANALYHSVNEDTDNTWGLRSLASPKSRALPTFKALFSPGARLLVNEGRTEEALPTDATIYGAVVCSWGMHASLVADSDTTALRKYGTHRFKLAADEALYPADGSPPHAYKASVSVLVNGVWSPVHTAFPRDGEKDRDGKEHLYVLATLVSNLEKTFRISPASRPLDGSLHLVYFGPMGGDEALRIMGLAYQEGQHVEDPAVSYGEVDALRIEFEEEDERWRRVCVDGTIVRVEKGGKVEVRRMVDRRVLDVVL